MNIKDKEIMYLGEKSCIIGLFDCQIPGIKIFLSYKVKKSQ